MGRQLYILFALLSLLALASHIGICYGEFASTLNCNNTRYDFQLINGSTCQGDFISNSLSLSYHSQIGQNNTVCVFRGTFGEILYACNQSQSLAGCECYTNATLISNMVVRCAGDASNSVAIGYVSVTSCSPTALPNITISNSTHNILLPYSNFSETSYTTISRGLILIHTNISNPDKYYIIARVTRIVNWFTLERRDIDVLVYVQTNGDAELYYDDTDVQKIMLIFDGGVVVVLENDIHIFVIQTLTNPNNVRPEPLSPIDVHQYNIGFIVLIVVFSIIFAFFFVYTMVACFTGTVYTYSKIRGRYAVRFRYSSPVDKALFGSSMVYTTTILCCIVLLIVPSQVSAQSCTQSAITGQQVIQCIQNAPDSRRCFVRPVFDVVFDALGSSACVDLVSNGTVVGRSTLTLEIAEIFANLQTEYITTPLAHYAEAVGWCFGENGPAPHPTVISRGQEFRYCGSLPCNQRVCGMGVGTGSRGWDKRTDFDGCERTSNGYISPGSGYEGPYRDQIQTNPCGKMSDDAGRTIGHTYCRSGAGGAGNGCGSVNEKTHYGRAYLKPFCCFFSVNKPQYFQVKFLVTMRTTFGGVNITDQTYTIIQNVTQNAGISSSALADLNLISWSQPVVDLNFDGLITISKSGGEYFYSQPDKINRKGEFVINKVGDMQCYFDSNDDEVNEVTIDQLMKPAKCVMADNYWGPDSGWNYNIISGNVPSGVLPLIPNPPYNRLALSLNPTDETVLKYFPATDNGLLYNARAGTHYRTDPGQIFTVLNNVRVTTRVTFKETVTFQSNIDVTCPELKLGAPGINGVVGNSNGLLSSIAVQYRSTCLPGVCTWSFNGPQATQYTVLNGSSLVPTDWTNGTIFFSSANQQLDAQLVLTCALGYSSAVNVSATLRYVNFFIPPVDYAVVNAPGDASFQGFSGLSGIQINNPFDALAKGLSLGNVGSIFIIIGIIVGVILLVVGAVYLTRFCVSRSSSASGFIPSPYGGGGGGSQPAPNIIVIPQTQPGINSSSSSIHSFSTDDNAIPVKHTILDHVLGVSMLKNVLKHHL